MWKRYLIIAACTTVASIGLFNSPPSVWGLPQQEIARTARPRFDNYPASPVFTGQPAPLDTSNPEVQNYEAELQEGMQKGITFAGHYVIVNGLNRAMGGVGTAVIVDLQTGQPYFPEPLSGYHDQRGAGYNPPRPDGGLHYHPNSKLLILVGRAGGNDGNNGIGRYYYKWSNNQLQLLTFIPSPYNPQ
ncbi:MAG: hypothetical protein VKL59_22255 [Nostocaceae cyanobacterium]|nr:hypothetical protein [Nostocaceae cyanobacterium]